VPVSKLGEKSIVAGCIGWESLIKGTGGEIPQEVLFPVNMVNILWASPRKALQQCLGA
jgi:hypothetical protein